MAGWGQFFSLGWLATSLSLQGEPGSYWKVQNGMISARPSYQGVRRWVWDPKTFVPGQKPKVEARPTRRTVSMERPGDWDRLMEV